MFCYALSDSLGLAPVQPRPAVWTRVSFPPTVQDVPLHTLAAPWEVPGADVLGPVTRRPSHGPWNRGRPQPAPSLWPVAVIRAPSTADLVLTHLVQRQRTRDTEVFRGPLRVSDALPGGPEDAVSPRP